jgi:lipocalin
MNLRVQSPNSRCSLSNNVEANYERRRAIGLPPINELHNLDGAQTRSARGSAVLR